MFVLTKEEKRVVCFVLLALLIGLGVKQYRETHPKQIEGAAELKRASQAASNAKLMRGAAASVQHSDSQVKQ